MATISRYNALSAAASSIRAVAARQFAMFAMYHIPRAMAARHANPQVSLVEPDVEAYALFLEARMLDHEKWGQ